MDEDEITIWASAFIPHKSFIFPFTGGIDPFALWSGDGRVAGIVDGASRVAHKVTINVGDRFKPVLSNKSFGGVTAVSFRPFLMFPRIRRTTRVPPPPLAVVEYEGGTSAVVSLFARTQNPLEPLSPYLSYSYRIELDIAARNLRLEGAHSQFPGVDLVIATSRGRKILHSNVPNGLLHRWPISLYYPSKQVNLASNF